MQLNPYYHIEIINNQFTIKENFLRPKTRNYGLKTLKKVTDILIHDLPYSSHLAHDRHYESDMQQKKVVLRRIAGQILENFQEKLKQLKKSKSPFKRNWIKLFGVNRQEKKIQHVYQKILKLSESASLPDLPYPSLLDLPSELIKQVVNYLPMPEIAQIHQTHARLRDHAQLEMLSIAKTFGYQGKDLQEALRFYQKRLKIIKNIAKNFQRDPELFLLIAFRKKAIDFHQTFRNFWHKSLEQPEFFQRFTSQELYHSILKKDKEGVDFLLKLGANPNQMYSYKSALVIAYKKSFPIFKRLLEAGANPDCYGTWGISLLAKACYKGQRAHVEELLMHKINVNLPDRTFTGESAIFACIQKGNIEMTKLLYAHGADLNFPNRKNFTPLHEACYTQDWESISVMQKKERIARFLIENFAHSVRDTHGNQPYDFTNNRTIKRLLKVHGEKL